jgi:DNA-binding transcriptional ArsR family regulator
MNKTVHVMPVGVNKDILLESTKLSGRPIQKVYLILGKDEDEKVLKNAEEIEKTLSVLVEVNKIYVDKSNIYATALDILKVIKDELKEGNEVLINASDTTRELCIACYVSAQLSGSKLYMAVTSNGKIESVIEVPIPPLKKISDDKLTIIKTLEEQGGEVESINKLIELLEGKTEDQKKYMAQRARMSYHLKGLEEDGLVEMRREGKNVRIKLTELGKAYALMADE